MFKGLKSPASSELFFFWFFLCLLVSVLLFAQGPAVVGFVVVGVLPIFLDIRRRSRPFKALIQFPVVRSSIWQFCLCGIRKVLPIVCVFPAGCFIFFIDASLLLTQIICLFLWLPASFRTCLNCYRCHSTSCIDHCHSVPQLTLFCLFLSRLNTKLVSWLSTTFQYWKGFSPQKRNRFAIFHWWPCTPRCQVHASVFQETVPFPDIFGPFCRHTAWFYLLNRELSPLFVLLNLCVFLPIVLASCPPLCS